MYTKEDIEKAKQYLDNEGYGTGSNFTLNMVANLMAEYAAKNCVMRWLDYPEHQPNIGDEVVICYTSNKELGLLKRELVEWTFKTMNNSANNPNLKFKWLRLPAIP